MATWSRLAPHLTTFSKLHEPSHLTTFSKLHEPSHLTTFSKLHEPSHLTTFSKLPEPIHRTTPKMFEGEATFLQKAKAEIVNVEDCEENPMLTGRFVVSDNMICAMGEQQTGYKVGVI
uniref:Uncharacterized protein n=1 Tax=Timema shepardi TaxID=629360 RepID=A0A7R9G268_TIMSH|nr:unnamed protein product [Timema shepardi]